MRKNQLLVSGFHDHLWLSRGSRLSNENISVIIQIGGHILGYFVNQKWRFKTEGWPITVEGDPHYLLCAYRSWGHHLKGITWQRLNIYVLIKIAANDSISFETENVKRAYWLVYGRFFYIKRLNIFYYLYIWYLI